MWKPISWGASLRARNHWPISSVLSCSMVGGQGCSFLKENIEVCSTCPPKTMGNEFWSAILTHGRFLVSLQSLLLENFVCCHQVYIHFDEKYERHFPGFDFHCNNKKNRGQSPPFLRTRHACIQYAMHGGSISPGEIKKMFSSRLDRVKVTEEIFEVEELHRFQSQHQGLAACASAWAWCNQSSPPTEPEWVCAEPGMCACWQDAGLIRSKVDQWIWLLPFAVSRCSPL